MRNLRASLLFGSVILIAACGGSDGADGAAGSQGPAGIGANGTNGSNGAAGAQGPRGDAGASFVPDAGAAPTHAPAGVTFSDGDFATGEVAGTIVVQHATVESDVTSYAVYFGKSATERLYLTPIFVAPADGADVSYPLIMNPIPAGATNLLAVAQNAAGESAIVATPGLDVGSSYVSVAAGPANSGGSPSLAIDAANSKLLVATVDASNSYKPSLFRCNLDGTSCTYTDISAGAGANSAYEVSLAIDAAGSKLLVATMDGSNNDKPSLFRCNLDGTSCTYTDISAGAGANSGYSPALAIDATNSKLLVATQDESNNYKPSLFRCNLDGTSCTYTDISAGAAADSGLISSLVVDAANSKLLVVTEDGSNSNKPSLFRCNLDGTSCTYTDISAGAAANSGYQPSLAIDATNAKLLVVTNDGTNGARPSLFRCNLDGTSCTYTNISAAAGANSGNYPSLAIDATHNKLIVATTDQSRGEQPAAFSCNLDGSACRYSDPSAGAPGSSGYTPKIALDAANGNMVIATQDASKNSQLGLFLIH
jgi:20S proteasome alpha/beta subunit